MLLSFFFLAVYLCGTVNTDYALVILWLRHLPLCFYSHIFIAIISSFLFDDANLSDAEMDKNLAESSESHFQK